MQANFLHRVPTQESVCINRNCSVDCFSITATILRSFQLIDWVKSFAKTLVLF